MEQIKLKRFKRILLIFSFAFVLGIGIFMHATSSATTTKCTTIEMVDTISPIKIDTVAVKDSIQQMLVNEVTSYLKKKSTSAHKFIPKYLVQAGLNHNIDICFMMAQARIETNFGTMGAGRESSRCSLFGVAFRKYGDYEIAINDYCELINKSYLGNGRTEKHLMTKFVTHNGIRYASCPKYEEKLTRIYKDIVRKTNIQSLQNEWNEMQNRL